jgi:hypothetical protein
VSLQQVAAIARTELRFGLRRGWPVVGTAVIGLVVSAGTLYVATSNIAGLPRTYAAGAGADALAMSWPVFQWLALVVLVGVLSPYPWGLAFRPLVDSGPFQGRLALLSRQAASDFIFRRHNLLPGWVPAVTPGQVLAVFLTALLMLSVAAAAARLWLKWREDF